MFTAPFVLDSTASEQRLGLAPTPMDDGLAATVAWWRAQQRAAA
jgi:nucleoside-diphosphate-sugar epimerase